MKKLLRRVPRMIANRLERLLQIIVGGRYDKLLINAYKELNGKAHCLIREQANIEYGCATGNLLRSRRFLKNIWYAQTRFFASGRRVELGASPLDVKELYIHCRSHSSLESWLYLRGFYDEILVLEEYDKYAREGTVAIDVGANIGVHTLALSCCVGEGGRVYSYEPRETLCQDLQKNLTLNQRSNVTIRNAGAGAKEARIPFTSHDDDFNQGAGMYDPASQVGIDIVALDVDLAHEKRPVSMIKIDVEGMEFEVIRGARGIIHQWMPVICLEHNSPPWRLEDLIREIPYPVKISRIPNTRHERMREVDPLEKLTGLNNLLLTPDVNRMQR